MNFSRNEKEPVVAVPRLFLVPGKIHVEKP
jgi:hypothetical protein